MPIKGAYHRKYQHKAGIKDSISYLGFSKEQKKNIEKCLQERHNKEIYKKNCWWRGK